MRDNERRKRNYNLCKAVGLTSLGSELGKMLVEGVISKRKFAPAFDIAKGLRALVTSWHNNYCEAQKSE